MRELKLSTDTPAGISDHYSWEVPDKNVCIQLSFDVVDRLTMDVMRGFGAVPRRGAEVGGVLIGTAVLRDKLIVTVDDYEVAACSYTRGPSYLLSPEDREGFRELAARWQPSADRPHHAVGFFRSHTRDGLGLAEEDLELFEEFFPHPTDIALLIKPFATKASQAGFFFREGDRFHTESSYQEFPFRRMDLGGGAPSFRERPQVEPISEPSPQQEADVDASDDADPVATPAPGGEETLVNPPKLKRGNVWIPLSFIFLILGVCLGLSVGHLMGLIGRYREAATAEDPYQLELSAKKSGDAIQLRWNRQAPALRKARRAVLSIRDGDYSNNVNIESQDLAGGSLFYRNLTNTVNFRLEVFTGERGSVAEVLDFSADAGNAPPAQSPASEKK